MHRRARSRKLLLSVVATAATAALLGGCGGGANPGTKSVSLRITTNFGASTMLEATETKIPSAQTVLALLRGHAKVSTSGVGPQSTVKSIAGKGGGSASKGGGSTGGSATGGSWFYFENGIQVSKGVAQNFVYKGDRLWFDLHDSAAADSVPAVVGSYPEPFTHGIGGEEFPTLLNCAGGVQHACDMVGSALRHYGVKAAIQVLGTGSGSDSLAVVVGTWKQVKNVIAAQLIGAGPAHSGVYGQFVGNSALELDNAAGQVARTLHDSVGLIAATGQPGLGQPTWFVTGTDPAGVQAAAKAFTASKLDGHFAVAVSGSRVIALPVGAGS